MGLGRRFSAVRQEGLQPGFVRVVLVAVINDVSICLSSFLLLLLLSEDGMIDLDMDLDLSAVGPQE